MPALANGLSPVAWTQPLRTYVDWRVWPLAPSAITVIAVLALAAVLAIRRDLGGAFVHERPGRADAAAQLTGPLALAFRQQRAALVWWLVGCVTMFGLSGLFIGRDAVDNLTAIADQNEITALIFGDDPLSAFLTIMMLHNALVVAVYAISALLRIRAEEDEGRLGLALSRPVARTGVLVCHLIGVALAAAVLVVAGGALPLWAGATISGGDVALATLLTSAATFTLGLTVLVAFAAALYAWKPRATPVVWALFGIVVVESFFGAFLDLPAVIRALSPFWWAGDYPSVPLDPSRSIRPASSPLPQPACSCWR